MVSSKKGTHSKNNTQSSSSILVGLNTEQQKAVTHGNGPLLIIAGAGTGKTTVITHRIAWLMQEKKLSSESILALTFTEKAAQEMEERVESLLPYGFTDLWISTFHSFAERLLHDHALDIGLPTQFKIASELEQWMLLRQHIDELELDYYKPLGNPTKFLHELIKHFSRAKDENVWPEQYLRYAEELQLNTDAPEFQGKNKAASQQAEAITEASRIMELAKTYHAYQQLLVNAGMLDFGDLILYALKLLRKRPQILQNYREQFQYILIDEFQDTNYAQFELIQLLAAPDNNLTVVADDDQSIYKFRGASVSNVLQLKEHYPRVEEISLVENYRSKQNILDLAYHFIQLNNPDRLETKIGICKKLKSQFTSAGTVTHLHARTLEGEVQEVLKKIVEFKEQNSETGWSDFAVLVRANDQATPFMKAFDDARVPYQFVASRGLYLKSEIIDLLSYLRLLDNYHESPAVYRVLNMPIFSVDHEDLVLMLYEAEKRSQSLYEIAKIAKTLKISATSQKSVEKLLALIEQHTQLVRSHTNVGKILYQFLEGSGLLKYYTSLEEQRSQYTVNLIRQMFKNIETFERANEERSVRRFLQYVRFCLESGDAGSMEFDIDEGPDTVKIMTIHAAKGLEFRYVFITNMVDKRFPSVDRKDAIALPQALVKEVLPVGDAHIQEERRLFYVACTRAREGLFFTSAEDYGGSRKKKLSRFLIEAGIAAETKKSVTASDVMTHIEIALEQTSKKLSNENARQKKFSFTQLKAYETCPYQYRFAHVLRVPVKGNYVFSFGKTMHAALQRFFQEMQSRKTNTQTTLFQSSENTNSAEATPPTLEELLRFYEQAWIDEWYPTRKVAEEYKKRGRESLTAFYKKYEKNWPKVLCIEKKFTLGMGDYVLKGAIDRIDACNSESIEIVDYKTGLAPAKPKKENEQLMIYAMAAQEVLKKEPKKVSFYYLNENIQHSYDVTQERLRAVQQWVEDIITKINTQKFIPTSGFHCRFCDFRDICDFRQT